MLALNHWHWLVIAMLFFISDVIVGGGFLLWIGVAALTLCAVTWVIPTLAWNYQYILFSITVVSVCFGWWHYLRSRPPKADTLILNRRTQRYIGQNYTLSEPIVHGRGKIRLGDSSWLVQGPELPVGTMVKIIGEDGVVLIVEATTPISAHLSN